MRGSDDLGMRFVFGNHPCCKAGSSHGQDGICINFLSDLHGSVANCVCRVQALTNALLLEDSNVVQGFFSTFCNFRHGFHSFQGEVTRSSFTGEHDYIRTVKDGVGNIACFRTGCTVAVHHAFQHLGSSNDRLACFIATGDNILLHQGYNLGRNLHTQIATGNHYAIRYINDFVNMVYARFVFNLRDNTNGRACIL